MRRERPFWVDDAGEATSIRALPDAAIDALSADVRAKLGAIWEMRAGMELHVGAAFAVITRELIETGADPAVLRLCARAIDDELSHAAICLALAERHDGRAHSFPAPEALHVPSYGDARGALLATLHLTAMACLNETIASVRLAAALRDCASPVIARALKTILSDEIEHARAGWAHLASARVSSADKREVAARLPAIIAASVAGLIDENQALPGDGFRTLGLPSVEETRRVALAAIDEVVLPGFAAVGVATDLARAWQR
jgi:hypothetical protein